MQCRKDYVVMLKPSLHCAYPYRPKPPLTTLNLGQQINISKAVWRGLFTTNFLDYNSTFSLDNLNHGTSSKNNRLHSLWQFQAQATEIIKWNNRCIYKTLNRHYEIHKSKEPRHRYTGERILHGESNCQESYYPEMDIKHSFFQTMVNLIVRSPTTLKWT